MYEQASTAFKYSSKGIRSPTQSDPVVLSLTFQVSPTTCTWTAVSSSSSAQQRTSRLPSASRIPSATRLTFATPPLAMTPQLCVTFHVRSRKTGYMEVENRVIELRLRKYPRKSKLPAKSVLAEVVYAAHQHYLVRFF